MSKKFRQFAYALLPEKIVAKIWLKSIGIEKYYILNNKVNVTQNVSLRYEDIDEFPIQFGHNKNKDTPFL